jgi:hypothetical protein
MQPTVSVQDVQQEIEVILDPYTDMLHLTTSSTGRLPVMCSSVAFVNVGSLTEGCDKCCPVGTIFRLVIYEPAVVLLERMRLGMSILRRGGPENLRLGYTNPPSHNHSSVKPA